MGVEKCLYLKFFWTLQLTGKTIVVYFDQQMHACACISMVENNEKHSKMMKKLPFPSCAREAHVRRMKNKNPNEQPAFRCQPDFGSHSQTLTNKLFSSFSFMRLTRASRAHDGKGTFSSFWNVFHCFRTCECMHKHAFAGRNTQQTTAVKHESFESGSFFYLMHFNHSNPD